MTTFSEILTSTVVQTLVNSGHVPVRTKVYTENVDNDTKSFVLYMTDIEDIYTISICLVTYDHTLN